MGVTKRAGRKKGAAKDADFASAAPSGKSSGVRKAAFESTKKKEVGVSDLTLISKITNEAINENLKKRFENKEIYTYIGHVLISVNPFRDLGIYTDEVLASYRGKNRLEMSPHVFAVAESSYYNMNGYKENQCIIISGESGAGKTEAAKRIMQYIAAASSTSSSTIQQIKDMVLATNPLLESFGCAKTLRNNNSSRHGKYLEIQFNSQGEPVGANITNYLLEKNRVVGQIREERNFHIFYQFAKAASQQHRELFGIQGPESYVYTSKSGCMQVPGIDDVVDFQETLQAMQIIGLSQQEQDQIFRMLSTILWLGNIQFAEDDNGKGAIVDPSVTDFVAYLLEVDGAAVNRALTLRIMETSHGGRRGSVYEVPLNPAQASSVRDALAKAIYNNLFEWIVDRVNLAMQTQGGIVANSIGILDIYGFEIFDTNSFEQLCINYVNEKLQQIFIQLTLRTEQEEYEREQIKWTPIKYFDNKVVCDLIEEKRPPGVFAALNDACATGHADPSSADGAFVQGLNRLGDHKHFENRSGQFVIKHYAGDVHYSVPGMTEKNRDQLLKDILELVAASANPFIKTLFPQQIDRDNKRRPPTAGDKIKVSANDLVQTLMKAQPSYIRTIKPNQNKSPTEYDVPAVLHQIKYLGLQENVRIRRAGFAYRQSFEKFIERFYLLSPKTSYAGDFTWTGDSKSGVLQILKDTSIPKDEWQMGVTKAFIKTPETLFALETMRDRYWHNMATRIQRAWRNYLRYRAECATRIQRAWRKKRGGEEFLKLRDQGHRQLSGKKERRRMSLLGSRRFMGDYLGAGNRGGPGEMLKNTTGISAAENVVFSCRGELLISKLGRSSKPSPRVLILTNRAFYVISQAVVNGQLSITAEHNIPIGAIKFIGMTNLRDDWFCLGIGSPQAPDPLISCVFKTELITQLNIILKAGIEIRINPTIEYSKKPGKKAIVKSKKDPTVPRDDLYKSSTIHVGPGEPPNSTSKPTPKGKQQPAKPITTGKLLRPGGPKGGAGNSRPAAARPLPQEQRPTPQPIANVAVRPAPATSHATPVRKPVAPTVTAAVASHARTPSTASTRPPPPPPPPPVEAPPPSADPMCKAKFDFVGSTSQELSVAFGDVVALLQKNDNGWWLVKRLDSNAQGWAPSEYLEEVAPPPKKAAPPPPKRPNKPPAPPKRPGVAGTPDRNSATGSSGASTSGDSFAGGLAEALKQRQVRMSKKDDDEDEW
ncbi:myosin IC heavy chain [Tricharina praecox]|uniref:myosin IC heavy chain n=1 Tax=Tricharina praecox TaxID=43433 RepID=UPI002220239D|nr:myosin IC heavy chain [Tricharina praecox]KAI5846829.1 myosin IC heavy chain [Tricharina praecox]